MAKESIDALVAGGKATAGPPLGPALGPMKVNIGQVIAKINEKTKDFAGMQVPVKVIVDTETKEFEITVGTPPAASLILKEAEVPKGAGNPLLDKVADLKIEQIIKISKMKEDALLGANTKSRVKEIIGTCQSMGILVEGVPALQAIKLVNEGKFDEAISQERTQLSDEDKKKLEEEKAKLKADMEARMEQLEATAKSIIAANKNKDPSKIKSALKEANIPGPLIEKTMAEAGVLTDTKAPAAAPAKK
jgi:large subunit ribosomal protein L11